MTLLHLPRTLDFFAGAVSAPMVMVAAFMSALMGSILAPMITAGMEAVSRLPVPDIEFPRIRRKTKSKAKYNHYEGTSLELLNFNIVQQSLIVFMDLC